MLRLHHVNLTVPVDGVDAETEFLVDILNYRRLELNPTPPPQARWFESEDGAQIHLSPDPDHPPSARAHVAVDLGDDLTALKERFDQTGYDYKVFDGENGRIVFIKDPAGN